MRDVFIDEIETDDLDGAVQEYLVGEKVRWIKSENPSGGVVFDINTDGLVQRITFTAV
jgi:hypothetical protein